MKVVELFAGAGGLGMGVSKAGFKPVRVIEWDRWCCDTIRENRKAGNGLIHHWPEPIEDDVRKVSFLDLRRKVDLVTGGPPCQPFSVGGRHRAHEDRRDMWSEAVRAVREIEPKAFIFENVKGLTRSSFEQYFNYILLQLTYPEIARHDDENWAVHFAHLQQHHTSAPHEGLMYNVLPKVLNAANYGVPQRRERVVFVGFRSDINAKWNFPRETHSLEALLWSQCQSDKYWDRHRVAPIDRQLDGRLHLRGVSLRGKPQEKPWLTVRDALLGLPDPRLGLTGDFRNHKFQGGARSYPGHTGSPLDEPAKTLKAGVHGVPGGENMLTYPDGTVRYFTVRESARLQTFPDDYELHGSWSEAMRQLGNAVPVELARVVANEVVSHLKKAA